VIINLEPKGKFLQIIAHTPCGRASFNTINNAEWHFVSWKARAFDRHKSGMFYRHFHGNQNNEIVCCCICISFSLQQVRKSSVINAFVFGHIMHVTISEIGLRNRAV